MNKIFFFCAILAAVAIGCKKTELTEPTRLFRPVIEGQLSVDSNTVVAGWLKISGAKSYRFQISRDTFRTIDKTLALDTNIAVVKGLLFNQLYQVQVMALAPDSVYNSKWSNLGAIKTMTSILNVPGVADITFNSVRVRWTTKGSPVTSIKIVKKSNSSVAAQVTLSPADILAENKIIAGLEAATAYTIFLYSGTDERGFVEFTTKAPFSGTVIDLSGITGRPNVLADTIPIIPSGSTVLLGRGQTYNIASAINLNKSMVIISKPDLALTAQAKIYFTNNFNFTAGATIDSLEFNDVYMYSDNYAARYVFNTTANATVGKIKFMNSTVEIFRGILRLQSGTASLGSFVINNCIVDSVSGFGVLTVGVATTKVDNVLFTNSTFYKCEKIITSASPSVSVLVDACTFNEAPFGNNSFYIDYGTTLAVTNGITVSNNIFGIAKTSAGSYNIKDLRASPATVINASNNFRTSDHLSTGNDLPNIVVYNRTSLLLWVNPFAGDFKINDNTFPGRSTSGDPRWRL
jgi:hypothetical protein